MKVLYVFLFFMFRIFVSFDWCVIVFIELILKIIKMVCFCFYYVFYVLLWYLDYYMWYYLILLYNSLIKFLWKEIIY